MCEAGRQDRQGQNRTLECAAPTAPFTAAPAGAGACAAGRVRRDGSSGCCDRPSDHLLDAPLRSPLPRTRVESRHFDAKNCVVGSAKRWAPGSQARQHRRSTQRRERIRIRFEERRDPDVRGAREAHRTCAADQSGKRELSFSAGVTLSCQHTQSNQKEAMIVGRDIWRAEARHRMRRSRTSQRPRDEVSAAPPADRRVSRALRSATLTICALATREKNP